MRSSNLLPLPSWKVGRMRCQRKAQAQRLFLLLDTDGEKSSACATIAYNNSFRSAESRSPSAYSILTLSKLIQKLLDTTLIFLPCRILSQIVNIAGSSA